MLFSMVTRFRRWGAGLAMVTAVATGVVGCDDDGSSNSPDTGSPSPSTRTTSIGAVDIRGTDEVPLSWEYARHARRSDPRVQVVQNFIALDYLVRTVDDYEQLASAYSRYAVDPELDQVTRFTRNRQRGARLRGPVRFLVGAPTKDDTLARIDVCSDSARNHAVDATPSPRPRDRARYAQRYTLQNNGHSWKVRKIRSSPDSVQHSCDRWSLLAQ